MTYLYGSCVFNGLINFKTITKWLYYLIYPQILYLLSELSVSPIGINTLISSHISL